LTTQLFNGIISTMTATPAKTDQLTTKYSMTTDTATTRPVRTKPNLTNQSRLDSDAAHVPMTCKGPDQTMWRYGTRFMRRSASIDMWLTMSPTVLPWRALGDNRNDFLYTIDTIAARICANTAE